MYYKIPFKRGSVT